MRAWPVNAPTAGATTEPRRCGKHVRGYDVGHLFTQHIDKLAVALATTRVLQGPLRPETQAPEDLDQLIFEIIGSDEHRPRAGGCQLAIPGQQPPAFGTGPLREYTILRSGLEEDSVEAEKPQPPREGAEHGVAKEARAHRIGLTLIFHTNPAYPSILVILSTVTPVLAVTHKKNKGSAR